jgi:DNA-binding NarL/FixJ family response regulator
MAFSPTSQQDNKPGAIRVLIADSTPLGSRLLADALRHDPSLDVAGNCSSSRDLLAGMQSLNPEVVVCSISLDEQPLLGFDLARELRSLYPAVKIVLLLDNSKRDLVTGAFSAGASGVFCRAESIEALCKCICAVHDGQTWANSREMKFVLDAFADSGPPRLVDAKGAVLLSKREQDVVRCVTEGLTNREIAHRLKLSEHTVKNYIFKIFEKLGVSTRVEMVLYAFSQRAAAHPGNGIGEHRAKNEESEAERIQREAEQGRVTSQLGLAEMLLEGGGVAKDPTSAYTWFLIAENTAGALVERSRQSRETLAGSLKPAQIAKAEKTAQQWLQQHRNGNRNGKRESNEVNHDE